MNTFFSNDVVFLINDAVFNSILPGLGEMCKNQESRTRHMVGKAGLHNDRFVVRSRDGESMEVSLFMLSQWRR